MFTITGNDTQNFLERSLHSRSFERSPYRKTFSYDSY